MRLIHNTRCGDCMQMCNRENSRKNGKNNGKSGKINRTIQNRIVDNHCRQHANKETVWKYIDTRKHLDNHGYTNVRECDMFDVTSDERAGVADQENRWIEVSNR